MGEASKSKIAVMISGGGTTLKNLLAVIDKKECRADIQLVLSSSASAAGNRFAEERGIELVVATRQAYDSDADYSKILFDECRRANVDWVVLGGFIKRLVIPADFENRVVNIHPSLIPAFCGQGMYGMNVHRAVVDYGSRMSGCTVHFVDNQYDHGPIITQRAVQVFPGDSPEDVQQRVFREECRVYPQVVDWLCHDVVSVDDRQVRVNLEELPL